MEPEPARARLIDMTRHQTRTRLRWLAITGLLVAALVAAACTSDSDAATSTPSPTPEGAPSAPTELPLGPTTTPGAADDVALAAYETARQQWDAADVRSYTFTLQRNCFCPPEFRGPFEITVFDGNVTEALYEGAAAEDGVEITVDEVFDEIEQALKQGVLTEISYDATDGHPVEVRLDLSAIAADGGLSLDLLDLTATS